MARQIRSKLKYLDPEVVGKLGSMSLVAREVVEGLRVGMHKSPLRGFSTEFAHHRQYVPGDEVRHVDWRVYGRTERFYVKLYEAETNFDLNMLLDMSRSMNYSSTGVSKADYAKYMAASLAYMAIQQHDAAGLAAFDDQLRCYVEPSGTLATIGNMEHALEDVQGAPRTNVSALCHEFAQRIPRKGFVMLFSDLFDSIDEFIEGLEHLRFRGHNLTVFHVLDPDELTFPFRGTCRFVGLENEPEIITHPHRIQEAYLQELQNFQQRIREACERVHADYVPVDTSRPLDVVLSEYLFARSTTRKMAKRR
jgi:uncharacterized protein (DUF58 family)